MGKVVALSPDLTQADGSSVRVTTEPPTMVQGGPNSVQHQLLKVVERGQSSSGSYRMVVSSSDTPLRQARTRRGWSLREAARELRLRAAEVGRPLPGPEVLVSMISRWELGRHLPGPFYRWLFSEAYAIPEAALFGVDDVKRRQFAVVALGAAVDAIVPSTSPRRGPEPSRQTRQTLDDRLAVTARESIELSRQVEASELGPTTLEHLEFTVERLGIIFLNTPPDALSEEIGWYRHRATELLGGRQTLAERRHLYVALGWLTGLLGHLAFDLGDYSTAKTHCLTAMQLAREADHRELGAWIRSLQAMVALYSGWFQEAAAFAWAGEELTADGRVGRVQLPVLAARAYGRLGDRRGADVAVHRAEEAFERLSSQHDRRAYSPSTQRGFPSVLARRTCGLASHAARQITPGRRWRFTTQPPVPADGRRTRRLPAATWRWRCCSSGRSRRLAEPAARL
jgi:transcriptional regulator with XRE-family HTH domain